MANWGTMGSPDENAAKGMGFETSAEYSQAFRPLPGMLRIGDPAPYEAAGLKVTYDPQYGAMINEQEYNSLPQVQAAANSNGLFGGALNEALTYAPLAGGALLGAAGLGAFGGAAAGAGEAAGVGAAGAGAGGGASAGTLGMFGGAAPMFGGEAALAGSGLGAATGGAGMGAAGLGALGTIGGAVGGGGGGGSGGGDTTFGIPNNLISGAAQGIGGLLSANAQGDAYKDVADKYLAIGAPYRGQLDASYQPGFDLSSQPGYGDAFSRIADISSRSYSAKMGNPADNPTAQAGILKDVWDQGYLPALTNYRGQLGQFGGLGLNTSGSASMSQAGTTGSGWEAIGAGVGTALGGNNSPADAAKKYGLSIGGMSFKG